jgi:hypothetical protein
MASGRPLYEPNPATRLAGHGYDIERLKRRLVPPIGVNPRIVFGEIDAGSDIPLDPGSGDWTMSPGFSDATGIWTITFAVPFGVAFGEGISVVATENGTSLTPANFIVVDSSAADSFVIKTYDGSTRALAAGIGFNFVAVGPAAGVTGDDPEDD